jgi:FdrA protein
MPVTKVEVRSGAYYDSVVLMQLQRALAEQPGVLDAGVVMGTDANKEVLEQSDLLVAEAQAAGADDLVIVVRGTDDALAQAALAKVDELVAARRGRAGDEAYHPRSLETAAKMLPDAQWVLVSVPGRYAAGVARQALRLNKHVFLYSDNVSLEDEIALKQEASQKGLLVMGPDCGTAIVNGIGLGFANKIRPGPIGLVAASGTGLQQVTVGSFRGRQCHQRSSGPGLDGPRPGYESDRLGVETARSYDRRHVGPGSAFGRQACRGELHRIRHGLAASGQRLLCHHL